MTKNLHSQWLDYNVECFSVVPNVFSFLLQNAKALKAKKEEGNKAFKEGNYETAYELYSEALTIDPNNIKTNAKLYCNRGTVGSKVKHKEDHLSCLCIHSLRCFGIHRFKASYYRHRFPKFTDEFFISIELMHTRIHVKIPNLYQL